MSGDDFLSRWSRRKRAAAAGRPLEEPKDPATPGATPGVAAPVEASPVAPASDAALERAKLPPVESLTIESDFSPFMAKDVDPALQRAALTKLFRNEQFNVMDGLDVYIDDYTKPSPIPADWYGKMAQMAQLGDAAGRQEAEEAAEARARGENASADDVPASVADTPGTLEHDAAQAGIAISQDDVLATLPAEDSGTSPP